MSGAIRASGRWLSKAKCSRVGSRVDVAPSFGFGGVCLFMGFGLFLL